MELWEPQTITDLESSLVRAKQATSRADEFYIDHAFAKGGIGALVATGTARAGLIRLQQRAEAAKKLLGAGLSQHPPSLRTARPLAASASASSHAPLNTTLSSAVSTRSISASHHSIAASRASFSPAAATPRASSASPPNLGTAALASVVVGGAAGLPESARHEWQVGVSHPANFVATARSSRVSDIRPGSRWAGLSYFETSRDEVKRHLEINHILEQQHKEDVERDLSDTDKRRGTWALQQREVFRRQRQEVAERYARAGVPERRAYSAMQANRRSVLETSAQAGSQGQQAEEHSLPLPSPRPLPRPSYPSVYPKTSKPGADLTASVYEVACMRQRQAGEAKEAAEFKAQLKALEEFERSLEMMQKNSRSSYEDHSQYPVISAFRPELNVSGAPRH